MQLIVGTDDWTDVDDMVALLLLVWAHVQGKIKILAVATNTTLDDGAPSMDGFMKFYGIAEDIPIGVPLTPHVPDGSPPYQETMRERTAHLVDPDRVYPDAVSVYRQALVDADPDLPLAFLELGYLNNYRELLLSAADGISPLSGYDLVASKVDAPFYIMGGENPSGASNNFTRTTQAKVAANYIAANWPTEIIYAGHEMGTDILTGGNLINRQAIDILAKALVDHGSAAGRPSWDPLTVMAVVARDVARVDMTKVRGSNAVDVSTGANVFTPDPEGKDCYLIRHGSDLWYQTMMNALLYPPNWATIDPLP